MKAFRLTTIALSISAALLGQSAHAVLERTGPTDPANGFPAWYQDTTGVSIELCVPQTQAELDGGHCLLLPGDAIVPEVFPTNFFDEHFWWAAGADIPTTNGVRALLVLALEAAFSADVAPGNQIAFTRIRVRLQPIPVSGSYRFIHPYGEQTIEGTAGDRIFFTDDVGIGAAGDFTAATTGRVGPFLLPSAAPGGLEQAPITGPNPGKLYIADPGRLGPVTGSSLPDFVDSTGALRNHNIFRIEGPAGADLDGNGNNVIETTDFSLMGRIFSGQMPSKMRPERASYARTTASDQQVDVFATAFPTQASRLPPNARPAAVAPVVSFYDKPCGVIEDTNFNPPKFIAYTTPGDGLETMMAANANWRWAQILPTGALPTSICLKDNSAVDINGVPVPVYHQLPVKDEVEVTEAYYDAAASTLTVSATSSDKLAPPSLSLIDFATANTPAPTLVDGTLVMSNVSAPPAKARVASSALGQGEYNVVVGAGSVSPPATVVAGNDGPVTIAEDSGAVLIDVLANDTLPSGPSSLAILTNASKGVASVAGSQISYTPNLNANGSDNFTYQVTAGGVTSNIATVSVNITPANDAPVANNDTALAGTGVPLVINVLANDSDVEGSALSIAAGSVSAVSPADGSSVQVTATNGLRFTGLGAGPYTFTYRASDGGLPSNPATVTVNMALIEQLTASPVDYVVSKNRWKVGGTTTNTTPHSLSLELAGPASCDGRLIGTTTSTGTTFLFDILNATGDLNPRTTSCTQIRVRSVLGGVTQPTTIRIK